jgi:hypothetical protein
LRRAICCASARVRSAVSSGPRGQLDMTYVGERSSVPDQQLSWIENAQRTLKIPTIAPSRHPPVFLIISCRYHLPPLSCDMGAPDSIVKFPSRSFSTNVEPQRVTSHCGSPLSTSHLSPLIHRNLLLLRNSL